MSIYDKMKKKPPYKLLALDGGGIRGLITIEILAKIETTLRKALGQDESFVLADYFDYIAGTSTGAIIAAALSIGMSIANIRQFYQESGKLMFDSAFILERLRYKYKDENLSNELKRVFGKDTTFGSDRLKTLLMFVMRNATTDSPWPLSNNPNAKYNDINRPDCNLKLPLWQLVRASTAAPTYFPPEVIKLGNKDFIFVDGGVTTYNNPAFQLFLMATLEPYKLMWSSGEDKMLLVSVGTGLTPNINTGLRASSMHLMYNAESVPLALMLAAQYEQDFLCRIFGKCLVGDSLDREIGDMLEKKGPMESKLFTYLRYNVELTPEGLDRLGGLTDIKLEDVQSLDSVGHMGDLQRIGQALGQKVELKHLNGFL